MDTVFKVVFRGEIAPGQDVDQVKRNIAALYKVQVAQCEKMFTGKEFVVKDNADAHTAEKYKKAFERVGAICAIEPHPPTTISVAASPQPKTPPSPKLSPHPKPVPTRMTCPKCQYEQPEAETCARCGIVIARYLAAQRQEFGDDDDEEQGVPVITLGSRPHMNRSSAGLPRQAGSRSNAEADQAQNFHWLGAPMILLVLLALALPLINISCNQQKIISMSGYAVFSGSEQTPSAEMAANVPIGGGETWMKVCIIAIILLAFGGSVVAVMMAAGDREALNKIGLAACGLGLLLTLFLGYAFGIRGENQIKAGQAQGLQELQRSMPAQQGAEAAAFGTMMAASMQIAIGMDAGYYLLLLAFLLGIAGHLLSQQDGSSIKTAAIALGIPLCIIIFLLFKNLTTPAQIKGMKDLEQMFNSFQMPQSPGSFPGMSRNP